MDLIHLLLQFTALAGQIKGLRETRCCAEYMAQTSTCTTVAPYLPEGLSL